MFTLNIQSFTTVNSTYSWDKGVPGVDDMMWDGTSIIAISGYAPYVRADFTATGGVHVAQGSAVSSTLNTSYTWDFGDYYNTAENRIIINSDNQTKVPRVSHAYVMPGVYIASYIAREDFNILNTAINDPAQRVCVSGGKQWRWLDTKRGQSNNLTWYDSRYGRVSKTWANVDGCVDRYCHNWSWVSMLSSAPANKRVQWYQTTRGGTLAKTWENQGLPTDTKCVELTYNTTPSAVYTQVVNPRCVITVVEIPPQANIFCTTSSTTQHPASAIVSPIGCVAGSFSFDRITYDFGDGSNLITVTRGNALQFVQSGIAVYNDAFANDTLDPRNYDIVHAYNSIDNKVVFYPSLTAYSANTNTSDSASTQFGPISLMPIKDSLVPFKIRAENKKIGLVSKFNDSVTFHNFTTENNIDVVDKEFVSSRGLKIEVDEYITNKMYSTINLDVNTPTNKIRNYPGKISKTNGNNGVLYQEMILNTVTTVTVDHSNDALLANKSAHITTNSKDDIQV